MTYKTEVWEYNDSPEHQVKMENIIREFRDTKKVLVAFDEEFPTGRAVLYFGDVTAENMAECEHVVNALNEFHYKSTGEQV